MYLILQWYNAQRDCILRNAEAFVGKLPILTQRLNELQQSGELEARLDKLAFLPGSEKVRGKEAALCRGFIQAVEIKIEQEQIQKRSRVALSVK